MEVGKKLLAAGPATSVPSTLRGKFSKNIPNIYQTYTKMYTKYIQIYPRYTKIYTKIYKKPSGGGTARPGPGAGPGPALYILVYLGRTGVQF